MTVHDDVYHLWGNSQETAFLKKSILQDVAHIFVTSLHFLHNNLPLFYFSCRFHTSAVTYNIEETLAKSTPLLLPQSMSNIMKETFDSSPVTQDERQVTHTGLLDAMLYFNKGKYGI